MEVTIDLSINFTLSLCLLFDYSVWNWDFPSQVDKHLPHDTSRFPLALADMGMEVSIDLINLTLTLDIDIDIEQSTWLDCLVLDNELSSTIALHYNYIKQL